MPKAEYQIEASNCKNKKAKINSLKIAWVLRGLVVLRSVPVRRVRTEDAAAAGVGCGHVSARAHDLEEHGERGKLAQKQNTYDTF